MPAPKLVKNRYGHFNALLKGGMQPFKYRDKATQLLGLKRSSPEEFGKPATLVTVHNPFRYTNTLLNDLSGSERVGQDALSLSNDSVFKRMKESDLPNQNEPNFNEKNVQAIKHDQDVVKQTKTNHSALKSTEPNNSGYSSLNPRKSSASKASNAPNIHNKSVEDSHLQSKDAPAKKAIEPDAMNRINPNTIGQKLQASVNHLPLENNSKSVSVSQENLRSDAPNIENKSTDSAVNGEDEYLKGVELKINSSSNHREMIKRYQSVIKEGAGVTHFEADDKTRAAMQRMQKMSSSEQDYGQLNNNVLAADIRPENNQQHISVLQNTLKSIQMDPDQRVLTKIEKSSSFRPLPQLAVAGETTLTLKNEALTKHRSKDLEQTKQIESRLTELSVQLDQLDRLNKSYIRKIADLESRVMNVSNSSTGKTSHTSQDSFWERNRMTHALIRMRS